MESTKEEIEKKIIATLKAEGKVNPSVVQQKNKWNKDDINEICNIFGKNKFNEVLESIPGVKLEKDSKATPSVWYEEDSVTPPHSASSAQISSDGEVQQKQAKSNLGINERFKRLLEYLNSGLYEKDEAIRLALLCAVAGENIFFLGPSGTAKSMISRRIKEAFGDDAEYFEHLMNEFTTPDEIFGTIKLKGLDEGIYEKNTDGFLPQANVAFLDEIWKSGPAILNTLLTIINEKKFHNGNKVDDVPLQILLAASNELPKEKSGLEALYDRFVVRTKVEPIPIKDSDAFFKMCENGGKTLVPNEDIKKILLTIDEVKSWQNEIEKVALGEKIREVISQIRGELERKNKEKGRDEKEKFYVSDRRWKKIVKLLKTSVFLCGRNEVDLMDCQLITYCIWNTKKQRDEAEKIVAEIVQEHGLEATTAIDDIEAQIEEFDDYIDETFYEEKPDIETPKLYKMSDGHVAYKLVKPTAIYCADHGATPYYISLEDVYGYNDRKGAYYDKNGDKIGGNYNFTLTLDSEIKGNTLSWTDWWRKRNYGYNDSSHSFKIETSVEKGKTQKIPSLFANQNQITPLRKTADEEHYKPIADDIAKELAKLEKFRADCERPYDENLFADHAFKEVIMSEINKAKKNLEDAEVKLKKQQDRYAQ